ncbi:sensor histidine kinase [Rugamonas sp.]|uniref:sensor histidine kinase n=1 Tax=Rugamonas sp. TaxID=1926287 RepID=UPI0025DA56C5|nr:sensor histidine kinase [Rugamonas sp.]
MRPRTHARTAVPLPLRALALSLMLLLTAPASAISESPFAGYFHTGWMPSDGAPSDIRGIVQDADGWLWIGGSSGLYRFDGHSFERMEAIDGNKLRKTNVLSLAYLDGALWVGYGFGGIERFKNGVATYFDEKTGLPEASVHQILQAPGGPVSATTSHGLYEWRGEQWTRGWPAPGQPGAGLLHEIVGADGALLINGGGGILRRKKNESVFTPVASDKPQIFSLFPGPDGAFWTTAATGYQQYDTSADRIIGGPPNHATDDADSLYVERDGTTWMGVPDGIQLLANTRDFSKIDELTRARGLSDRAVQFFFQDREDNVWLGTSGGIDRLRRSKVHTFAMSSNTRLPGIAPDNDGALWVSSRNGPPLRRTGADGKVSEYKNMPLVETIVRGADGTVWAANSRGVARYVHGEERIWPLPGPHANQPQGMVQDPDGALWLSMLGSHSLHRLRDGRWDTADAWRGYDATALFLQFDERHRLWQTYTENRVAVSDGSSTTRYSAQNGLKVGNVLSISTRGGRVWVGGDQGLMFLKDEHFIALLDGDGKAFTVVSGIVETAEGDLWLHGAQGLTHIAAAAARRALAGGATRVEIERMDYEDGILGQASHLRPLPSLIEGPDGRLWYVTNSGVGWIDPLHVRRNALPPPVKVRALVSGGRSYALAPGAGPRLPPRSDSLRLDYTALTLTMPERVRFRYRLLGVDAGWVEAGARRSAYYTNLGPGAYRFDVQAANEDGVWNSAGAQQQFAIAPALVQTTWFRLLCGGAAPTALWLLYRWRLHQLSQRMRARMDERLDERSRIARELHDTVLQSVHGLVLKVHGASIRLPAQEPVRGLLDEALTHAEDTLTEGRKRVLDLRSGDDGRHLLALLTAVGAELAQDQDTRCTVRAESGERPLAPGVDGELFAIAREAMGNAFHHARAAHVTVNVYYGPKALTVTVADDGAGIAADILASGGRGGHFGLVGMRERAARLGGALTLGPREGGGTECVLKLPAARAYAVPRARWWA